MTRWKGGAVGRTRMFIETDIILRGPLVHGSPDHWGLELVDLQIFGGMKDIWIGECVGALGQELARDIKGLKRVGYMGVDGMKGRDSSSEWKDFDVQD